MSIPGAMSNEGFSVVPDTPRPRQEWVLGTIYFTRDACAVVSHYFARSPSGLRYYAARVVQRPGALAACEVFWPCVPAAGHQTPTSAPVYWESLSPPDSAHGDTERLALAVYDQALAEGWLGLGLYSGGLPR